MKRLYELAEREKLLDDPAFESMPVPYVVVIGANGEYLGIEERRGLIEKRNKKGEVKTEPDKGKPLSIAKAHGNTANAGFARFFADTLARVLPTDDAPKSQASRTTFWRQMEQAAAETKDPGLQAVCAFGKKLADPDFALKVRQDAEAKEPDPGDRCTFAYWPDEGMTILERSAVRDWWRAFYEKVVGVRAAEGPQGLCQITEQIGPIATTHPKIAGVPGGIASGAGVVAMDKAAFESYALDGAANAAISLRAADGYTRALNALIAQNLPGRPRSAIRIGETLFVFWTRDSTTSADFMAVMDQADPAQVADLLTAAQTGQSVHGVEENDFYCLTLSGNAARVILRDYLEFPVLRAKRNLAAWFADLQIVEPWGKEISGAFPLWMLVGALVRRGDDVPPTAGPMFLDAALRHEPLPDNILASCLRRFSVEGGEGFTHARAALVKLCLNRQLEKGDRMSEQLDPGRSSPAYVCGRLLAVFEYIQWAALGKVNANVVDRFYGTASTAPSLVFSRLFKSAQQHLSKLSGEKAGMAVNLQKDLESLTVRIDRFPVLLSLAEQGEFALGFYHQRAAYRKGREQENGK